MFENNKKIKKHKHTLNFFFFLGEKAYIEFEREVARVGVLMCFGFLWAENGKPLSYEGVFIHWRRQKKSPLRVLDIDSDLSGFLFNNSAIICFFNHICCNIACVSLGFFFFSTTLQMVFLSSIIDWSFSHLFLSHSPIHRPILFCWDLLAIESHKTFWISDTFVSFVVIPHFWVSQIFYWNKHWKKCMVDSTNTKNGNFILFEIWFDWVQF